MSHIDIIAEADRIGAAAKKKLNGAEVQPTPVTVDLHDFIARDIPKRPVLLAPTILAQSLIMVHSWRGVGKTHLSLGLAYALASGGKFLRWSAETPRKVLYVDGEMPARALQERLASIIASAEREAAPGFFRLMTPDLQDRGMPDLGTVDGQHRIDAAIEDDTSLIVVDNLSCMVRSGGAENEAESWRLVSEWALRHRAAGRSIIFDHHSGKNGAQRGTSKREDLLDVVLALKTPSDYEPTEGARFEVHYEKKRGFFGEDVAPFEAQLTVDEHGASVWSVRSLEDTTDARVHELLNMGMSKAEIARELGVNKSTVTRATRRLDSCDGSGVARLHPRVCNTQLSRGVAQQGTQRMRNDGA